MVTATQSFVIMTLVTLSCLPIQPLGVKCKRIPVILTITAKAWLLLFELRGVLQQINGTCFHFDSFSYFTPTLNISVMSLHWFPPADTTTPDFPLPQTSSNHFYWSVAFAWNIHVPGKPDQHALLIYLFSPDFYLARTGKSLTLKPRK